MFRVRRPAVLLSTVLLAAISFPAALHAQFQNPITAAKDAYNKAKAQQKQQQQQQQQQQQKTGQAPAAQQGASGQSTSSTSDNAAPWVPPGSAPVTTSAAASTTAAAAAAVKLDPSKMPDIVGVHLGMTATEALAAAHRAYGDDMFVEMKADFWPTAVKPDYGFNIHSRAPGNFKDLSLSFTAPPAQQTVWKVDRMTQKLHTNRDTLIAALRQKYGKESFAWQNGATDTAVTNDKLITGMLWLYDEQGNHVPMPDKTVFTRMGDIDECTSMVNTTNEPVMPKDTDWVNRITPWCAAHYVALSVSFPQTDIVEYTTTSMIDVPLAIRNARAGDAWLRDYANRVHQEDVQRSKENKPTL